MLEPAFSWQSELELAKILTKKALDHLARLRPSSMSLEPTKSLPREMKSAVDQISEDIILGQLLHTEFPVLSEEAGLVGGKKQEDFRWIIDPLDGTVNFVRGIGSCAVSIAFWQNGDPIFGVIGEFPSGKIAWGGREIGSCLDGRCLQVSGLVDKSKAVLCTGFPSRFDFSENNLTSFASQVSDFGKVRMLGSAALSLLSVARGATDAYSEQDIMIWDVAGGLALVQGAGGKVSFQAGKVDHALNVYADNGMLC